MTTEAFEGKVALVTGGGTGIGAAVSGLLADRGAAVVIAQPDQESATRLAAQLASPGRDVRGIGANVAVASDCAALVEGCIAMHGRIDVLVNNAAVTGDPAVGEFLDFPESKLDEIVDVNLKGVFRCSRHAARYMASHGGGVIVNIASVGAYAAQRDSIAYVATKAGVVGLTRGLAFDLASAGIRVNAVAPGDIDTAASSRPVSNEPYFEASLDWWERRSPMGRRGEPADIARVVAFLASPEADYVTGETVIVDGGWLSY